MTTPDPKQQLVERILVEFGIQELVILGVDARARAEDIASAWIEDVEKARLETTFSLCKRVKDEFGIELIKTAHLTNKSKDQ